MIAFEAIVRIVNALLEAKNPLIVTSYLGRNTAAVQELTKFVELLALPVFQSCPTYVNLPYDHPSHAGLALGGKNKLVEEADCILVIDSDIPWFVLAPSPLVPSVDLIRVYVH
jgi:acetolactate synthase-1/2/3 large subunit